jgi:hypothetical protein
MVLCGVSIVGAASSAIAAAPDDGHGATVAESDDPLLPGWAWIAIVVGLVALFALVRWRGFIAAHDRREITWTDAWAKTLVIVVALILSTVYIPAKALELGIVQDMPRAAQDLIAVGLWSGALAVSLLVLWYAHRERRI